LSMLGTQLKGPTKAGPQIKVGTPVTALIVFLSYLTFCL